jgi:hypothetical protein
LTFSFTPILTETDCNWSFSTPNTSAALSFTWIYGILFLMNHKTIEPMRLLAV